MGFIKNALIGIALYEAVKYFLRKDEYVFEFGNDRVPGISHSGKQLRNEEVDVIAGAKRPDHLQQTKDNASLDEIYSNTQQGSESRISSLESEDDLLAGSDPEVPLTGQSKEKDRENPWKNSLANDELRAPDS